MSMLPEPLVRARFVQDWLLFVDAEEEPWRGRFRALLPAQDRATIDATSRVGWLPLRYHVLLADVLAEAFGPQRSHAFYRRAFVASLATPIFRPLVTTAARVLGFDPGSACKWYGRAWATGFKFAGDASGEVLGPGRGRVEYRQLPAVCSESQAWLESCVGCAYGLFDLTNVDGVARLDLSGRAEGRLRLEIEWAKRT
jgi:hypothetical protein